MTTTDDPATPACLDAGAALRWLRSRLRVRPGRTLVGIDGPADAETAVFAEELAALLTDGGQEAISLSLDDYGLSGDLGDHPHAEVAAFVNDVIGPLRNEGSGRYRIAPRDDDPEHPRWACASEQAIVLIEGTGLHRSPCCTDTHKVWDLSIWLGEPTQHISADQLQPLPDNIPNNADLVVDDADPHARID